MHDIDIIKRINSHSIKVEFNLNSKKFDVVKDTVIVASYDNYVTALGKAAELIC